MTPERWARIDAVLDAALELPRSARAAHVARACDGDPTLHAEVLRLLDAHDADGPLTATGDRPAAVWAAPFVAQAGFAGDDDAEATSAAPRTPTRVGPWRLLRTAGEGGMGTVHEAVRDDGAFRMRVALKLLKRGLHRDEAFVRRFHAERQILARLDHPGIARLLDGGVTDDGVPFYVMEFVRGRPIDVWCDAQRLAVPARLALFARVCDAVAAAHTARIVHRDLKPSNIIVSDAGEPKLLDFGIAKLLAPDPEAVITTGERLLAPPPGDGALAVTNTGQRLLTPAYASPEQVRGGPVTAASDVWALGVVLHELLTGLHPFAVPGALARDVEEAILSGEVPRMASRVREAAAVARGASAAQLARTLRGGLETIVRTAMHTEPHRRYAHAAALADDVRRHLAGRPLLARGDGAGEWTLAFARRHRLALAGALGVVAGVAVLALTQRARGDALPRLEAGATRRIAFDAALELDPQLSPDGTQLAYASDADGTMRIHVRPVAGGAARVVSAGVPGQHRAPRWSPDGGALAFQGNGALWRVALRDDATPVPLVRPARGAAWVASPAWSPDGRQLAYVQDWVVHVRDLATGATRALLPPRALAAPHSLAWSPDGTRLALVDNNAEFVFGLEGGTVNLGNIAPSALVVLALGDDHRTVRSVSRVTTGGALATSPAWLPDSRGLLYVSDTDGDRDVYHLTLAADGSARAPATRLTAGLGAHTIAVSRDGAQLTYSVFRSSANLWALALPARGAATLADARPLTTGRQSIEGFAISPDGTRLAYDSNVRGNQDVLVIPFDATRAVAASDVSPLVADAHDDFMPHWSPDGRELAYYRYDSSATRSLRVVSAGGGASRPVIAEPRNQRYPGWSRDGTALVFEREQSGVRTLWTVRRDVTGGWQPARPLVRDGGDPRWSPTSDTIAYVRDSGIWLVAATGGEPRRLVAFSPRRDGTLGVVQWSRDGRAVLYKVVASSGAATILRASLAGGPPERVAVLDDLRRPSARPEFDSDGRQLVVTLAERESDIWTMALRRAR